MYYRRSFWIDRIESAWERRSLVWLSGVRRSGKTVLCNSLDDVDYFDCDLPSVRSRLEDPERFLASMGERRIVLDEVQRLRDPAELLKIAADHFPRLKIVATGSSTLQASTKFRDTLTGRKTEIRLTPMMSQDVRDFGDGDLMRRLGHGGLPPFYLADPLEEADFQEWMDSYWARDIQELFRLESRASFLRCVELVLARSGGIFEATAFAAPCEVSRTTVSNYLAILQETGVAYVVRPFSTRRSTEIVATPKVYGFDTGFIRIYRGWRELRPEDLGLLWEHYVLNEIRASLPLAEVRYWRDTRHKEVDFVVVPRGGPSIAIECKWSSRDIGDLSGLRAFRRAYPEGPNLLVAPDVDVPYTVSRGGLEVRIAGLGAMVESLRQG